MTVSTALLATGAPDFVRQAILGHEQNQIINRHYTEANLGLLKKHLDRIDLGLEIVPRPAGFPVIAGCSLLQQKALEVTLHLDDALRACRIEVRDPETETCTVIEPQLSGQADADAAVADMERMGVALAEALADRAFRIVGEVDLDVERRLEMLLDVGTSDRNHTGSAPFSTRSPAGARTMAADCEAGSSGRAERRDGKKDRPQATALEPGTDESAADELESVTRT